MIMPPPSRRCRRRRLLEGFPSRCNPLGLRILQPAKSDPTAGRTIGAPFGRVKRLYAPRSPFRWDLLRLQPSMADGEVLSIGLWYGRLACSAALTRSESEGRI